jgi:hypothetical protein
MTTQQVKNELPDVIVITPDGKRDIRRVAGRQNKFATVYNPQTGDGCEVAWTTIARAVTNKTPIRL